MGKRKGKIFLKIDINLLSIEKKKLKDKELAVVLGSGCMPGASYCLNMGLSRVNATVPK